MTELLEKYNVPDGVCCKCGGPLPGFRGLCPVCRIEEDVANHNLAAGEEVYHVETR